MNQKKMMSSERDISHNVTYKENRHNFELQGLCPTYREDVQHSMLFQKIPARNFRNGC